MNRRLFLGTASALALSAAAAWAQTTVDAAELLKPSPDLPEMQIGKPDAPVTIVEYASASCPHCAKFHNDVLPVLKTEYVDAGKVRIIFREFPHNDAAMGAFMLARCAPQEKYFPLMEVYFKTQEQWLPNPFEGLKAIALQAGFTEQTFQECLNNEKVAKNILAVRQRGEGFGVQGIPTFFINGERFGGEMTIEAFRAQIDPLVPKT